MAALTVFNFFIVAMVFVVAESDFVVGNIPPDSRPCYDYLCRCYDHEADCSHQGNKLTFIPKLMAWVTNIVVFKFSFNQLFNFTDRTVENITDFRISYLRLRSNDITYISAHAFDKLKHLLTLDLSDNPVHLQQLSQTFENMPSSFAYVYLEGLNIHDSDIEGSLLQGLKKRGMTGIHLARNHLEVFNFSLFSDFTVLSSLSLEQNHIVNVSISQSSSATLSTLWLDHNNISTFPDFCHDAKKTSPSFPLLYTLSIEFNHIEALGTFGLRCLNHVGHLFLSGNQLSFILPSTFAKLHNLQILNISHNSAHLNIRNFAFINEKLKMVKLTHSRIVYFADDSFRGNNCSLTNLDLSSNNVSSILPEPRLSNLLEPCRDTLSQLNLNNCSVNHVPNIVPELWNLKILFLDNNEIRTIGNNEFDNNHKLTSLSLAHNDISTLNDDVISNSVRSALSHASLEDNPFVCSCEIVWLRNWLIKARSLFSKRLTHYNCKKTNENVTVRIVDDPSITYESCFHNHHFVRKALCSVVVVLICIICFALGYKWRWYIRYCVKWKRGNRAVSEELQPLVTNDAYILYCDEDYTWVRHQLLPNLEERGHLKMCFRHRDFNPKVHIVDSIVYHIRHSKKALFVLSNNFFKNSGSQFELSLVKQHLVDSEESLVAVLLEEIDNRYMTQDLYRLLKGREHVRWTGSDMIWRNLLCQFRGTGNRLV